MPRSRSRTTIATWIWASRCRQAILDGAAEVATPAFVATLSICIVFVPILFLSGVGGSLFAPLAMSVVFAMLASYLLSRTLVPTMVLYLLAPEARARHASRGQQARTLRSGGHSSGGSPIRFEPGFRDSAAPTRARSTGRCTHARRADRGVPWLCARLARASTRSSAGTSFRPSMRVSSGCMSGPGGDEDRADGSLLPAGRGLYPSGHPRRRAQRDRRQHRRAERRSTWRSATVSRSDRPMARSWWRSIRRTARPPNI